MYTNMIKTVVVLAVLAGLLTACMETAPTTRNTTPSATATSSTTAPTTRTGTNTSAQSAPPTFGNPSPTVGSSTSQQANAAADVAAYREIDYKNKARKGPALVVIPPEGGVGTRPNRPFSASCSGTASSPTSAWGCRRMKLPR